VQFEYYNSHQETGRENYLAVAKKELAITGGLHYSPILFLYPFPFSSRSEFFKILEMSKEEFCLVDWVGENRFSVISRTKVVELKFRDLPDTELIGKTIKCFWSKRKQYFAKILQTGEMLHF